MSNRHGYVRFEFGNLIFVEHLQYDSCHHEPFPLFVWMLGVHHLFVSSRFFPVSSLSVLLVFNTSQGIFRNLRHLGGRLCSPVLLPQYCFTLLDPDLIDALQQARLVSVLDQREIIEREIQSTAWKGEIADVLRHYQKRQQEQHYVPRKYQPVLLYS